MPDGIEATIMAIRETLMDYFKGGCVESMASARITLDHISSRTNYRYERQRSNMENGMVLSIGPYMAFTLSQSPDVLTIHMGTMDRGKIMRSVRQGVEEFMGKYLRGVTIKQSDYGDRAAWRYDKKLVQQSGVKMPNKPQQKYEEMLQFYTQGENIVMPQPLIYVDFNFSASQERQSYES